jgi:hypothetical protein
MRIFVPMKTSRGRKSGRKVLLFIFLIQLKKLTFMYKMRRKSLTDLVGKINKVLPGKGRVIGTVIDKGKERSRTDSKGRTWNFEYRFLREVARDFIYSENGGEEWGRDWAERGIGLLEYRFGDKVPKINVTKRGKDEANVEILYVPREIEKPFEDERKVERLDEVEKMRDITEFAKAIYLCATFPRRKKGAILEVRGEINETRHPPEFIATVALGVKYDGVKNMKDYKQFSEIYERPQNEDKKYNKSEDINNRLIRLENEILKSPENPKYYFSKRAIREAPEITLDEKREILVVRPFQ